MAPLLTTGSQMMCPHGGTVSAVSSNTRAKATDPILRSSDTFTIAGCPFTAGPNPHPCVSVSWSQPASNAKADGDFALTAQSTGLCEAADKAAQGTVMIVSTQSKVTAK
jgi:hypothetical protein